MENKDNRAFFSVIIPCYNSNPDKIKELMDSIIEAGCQYETEIVVSDDRSFEKEYINTIEEYKDKFYDIKIVDVPTKDINGTILINSPANNRENGVRNSTGKWITFVDHDDLLEKDALIKVKDAIEETGENFIVYSNFKILDMVTNEERILEGEDICNWLHGKFYNLDNFWKAFDFHFKTNIQSHEDIAIATKMKCICNRFISKLLYPDICTYVWRKWPNSVSHIRSDFGRNFVKYIYDYFYDFIKATMETYVEDYDDLLNKNNLTDQICEFHKNSQIDIILYMYFYIQVFKYNYTVDFNNKYEAEVKYHIHQFYKRFNMNPVILYDYACTLNDTGYEIWFTTVRKSVLNHMGLFIETDSFYDFISK